MPHKGAMRLIRMIVSADDTRIHCRAKDHTKSDYPLRLEGVLYAATLAELGAQAAAAHASLFEMRGAHTGLLVALQDIKFPTQEVGNEHCCLDVFAEQLQFSGNSAIYQFRVGSGPTAILDGRATLTIKKETK